MANATVVLDPAYAIGTVDPRIYGSFVEHLGRCVYTGIFEPGHPEADAAGLRQDVLALVRELGVTVVRYPGGNFVSGYDWEDGVGPPAERPRRRELAWFSTETNAFGTDEFIDWCRAAGVAPMMAVNLGTRGADEARALLEYCNVAAGTALSDRRRAHGRPEPHDVRLWCLGNEMDAPWQIGAKPAAAYGALARETAKLMRWIDPGLELVACGSSSRDMASFAAWEREVLEECFDQVEYISLHEYFSKRGDSASFLATADKVGGTIEAVVAVADAVAARRRSDRRIMLSFDEWNVWYRTRDRATRTRPGWPEAPAILEEAYTMEDTLVFAAALNQILNHCDRVRIACVAQLVNVIAPIMTAPGGPAWRQTIFHPFAQAARHGRGTVLDARVSGSTFGTPDGARYPHLSVAAVLAADGSLALFCVNRDLAAGIDVTLDCRGLALGATIESLVLSDPDIGAANTAADPERVRPRPGPEAVPAEGGCDFRLPPASWAMLRLETRPRG